MLGAVRVGAVIAIVTEADLPELLPLMRGYCDFYEVAPSDEELLAMSRVLIATRSRGRPADRARRRRHAPSASPRSSGPGPTLSASRLGVMNDLFVAEDARGGGAADALIAGLRASAAAQRGATELAWQTASTNLRAQAVYDRVGATRDERWLDYSLTVAPGATTPDS